MKIASYDEEVAFNLDSDIISELATYGVIAEGTDGMCEIVNPIYQYRIMRAFKPIVNGLEQEYLPENNRAGFQEYLTPDGQIQMAALLDNNPPGQSTEKPVHSVYVDAFYNEQTA